MARKSFIESGSVLSSADVPDLQSRIIQNDAVRNGRAVPDLKPVAEENAPSDTSSYDQSYGNMTNQSYNKSDDKSATSPAGNTPGLSAIQQSILAAVKKDKRPEDVLKTVTIKLSYGMDKKVEEHMRDTGRLKQDIVRDALMLYFETIQQATDSAGGD